MNVLLTADNIFKYVFIMKHIYIWRMDEESKDTYTHIMTLTLTQQDTNIS